MTNEEIKQAVRQGIINAVTTARQSQDKFLLKHVCQNEEQTEAYNQELDLILALLQTKIKTVHKFSSSSEFRGIEDFSIELIADSYEDGIAKIVTQLARENHVGDVDWQPLMQLDFPVLEDGGHVDFKSFVESDPERRSHKWESQYIICDHPAYAAEKQRQEEESTRMRAAMTEKAKAEQRARELAIYEKIKKELEGER